MENEDIREDETRWQATVYYRSEGGLVEVTHDIEELEELQDLVERGPNFYTIERIEIRIRDLCELGNLTIEEAAQM